MPRRKCQYASAKLCRSCLSNNVSVSYIIVSLVHGEVSEWLKVPLSKSGVRFPRTGSSNLPLSAKKIERPFGRSIFFGRWTSSELPGSPKANNWEFGVANEEKESSVSYFLFRMSGGANKVSDISIADISLSPSLL